MHFGPRHLDFHPTQPWVYVSIESQNKLYVYRRDAATGLSREPLFVKETLSDPASKLRQAAGPIHVSPDGRFVYLTNRAWWLTDFEGKQVFAGGENSVAVFAIDQTTGEPTLIQNADGHANYLRTFAIDPTARILVAASVWPMPMREGRHHHAFCRNCHLPHRRRRQAHLHAQARHRGERPKAAVLGRDGHTGLVRRHCI